MNKTIRSLAGSFLFFLSFFSDLGRAAEHWDIQYQYKQLETVLTLNDVAFPGPQRGFACGYTLDRKGKDHPFAVATSDGGAHWAEVPVKDTGLSLFFLNDSEGWMVTSKGLFFTGESGRSWSKLKAPAGLLKVWFLDRQHGYGVGLDKTAAETHDGGDTWVPLPVLSTVSGDSKYTTFGEVVFDGQRGVISGWNIPPRRGGPDWMEAQRNGRPQWPNLSVVLQTSDGGKTWDKSEASIFGQITRFDITSPDGLGIGLLEFHDNFQYPSEIYGFNLKGGKMERIFRQADRAITDVKQLKGTKRTLLAGFETSGTVYRSPIPGKLKVLVSDDLANWSEMEVDYRAVARRAILASPDKDHVWIGTDTGMILKLVND